LWLCRSAGTEKSKRGESMNDYVREIEGYIKQVERSRQEMEQNTSMDPAFDIICLAATQKGYAAAAQRMLDEAEIARRDLVQRVRTFLPAPVEPQKLHAQTQSHYEPDAVDELDSFPRYLHDRKVAGVGR
jgi:hypothetical protein